MIRAVLLAALLLVARSAAAFDPFAGTGIDLRPGAQVPLDAVFHDQKGGDFRLREVAGNRPIVLVPVVHRCPNICGVTLGGLAQAIAAQKFVAGRDFDVVALGIDPRETPVDAAQALDRLHHAFPGLAGVHGLVGSAGDVAAVTGALGYRYAWDEDAGQYAHIAAVAVLTSDGRLSRWIYGVAPDPNDLHLALTEAGQGRIGSWADQLLLLCYRYDPQHGRYGSLIWAALRIAGAMTALGGAGLIARSLLRERHASPSART